MYGNGCGVDDDPVDWALTQLDIIANLNPRATAFMKYIKDVWGPKTSMWCVGRHSYVSVEEIKIANLTDQK